MTRREKEILKLCLMTVMDEEQKGTASYRDAHNYIVQLLSKNTYINLDVTTDEYNTSGKLVTLEKDLIEICIKVLNDDEKFGTINYNNAKEYIISIAMRCTNGEL